MAQSRLRQSSSQLLRGLRVSIGVRPVNCTNLEICNCEFRFSFLEEERVLAVGIFAAGRANGLKIEHNRFSADTNSLISMLASTMDDLGIPSGEEYADEVNARGDDYIAEVRAKVMEALGDNEVLRQSGERYVDTQIDSYLNEGRSGEQSQTSDQPQRQLRSVSLGYVLMPSIRVGSQHSEEDVSQNVTGSVVGASLDDAHFVDNTFSGLTLAGLIVARTGQLRIDQNTVQNGYGGFYLAAPEFFAELMINGPRLLASKLSDLSSTFASQTDPTNYALVQFGVLVLATDPVLAVMRLLLQGFPLPGTSDGGWRSASHSTRIS